MQVLLVRHGAREDGTKKDEPNLPLNETGRSECAGLLKELDLLKFKSDVWLSSTHEHSKETARLLGATDIHELAALTPHSLTETLNHILEEAKARKLDLPLENTIAIVGHEPRLGQLFTRLTSERVRPLGHCEALCVEGSWNELVRGTARAAFRTPVLPPDTETLMDKVHRKMEVSVFLAAFTIPALIEVVKDTREEMELDRAISAIALTLSLAFYVAAVYLFDELSMPEGFWEVRLSRPEDSDESKFAKNYRRFGHVYAYMLRTWFCVFTPGVFLSAAGFLTLFWHEETKVPTAAVGVVCLIGISLAVSLYANLRPRLATD